MNRHPLEIVGPKFVLVDAVNLRLGLFVDISIDFETRSRVDVPIVGSYRYARDRSTRPMMMAYDVDGYRGVWVPPFRCPFTAEECQTALFHAFHAAFERELWNEIMVKRHGWPEIPFENWRCTAARGLCNGLPASLAKVSEALDLVDKKDQEGHRIMLQLCKPRTESKNDKREWFDDLAKFEKCIEYCEQDVATEVEIQTRTYGLTARQLSDYQLSERINSLGIPVDVPAIERALRLLEENKKALSANLEDMTGGQVKTARQVAALKNWLVDQGANVGDTLNATDVSRLIEETDLPQVKKVLEIRQQLARSASDKIAKMKNMVCDDGRIRGCHIYHKSHTGRFAGDGLQPLNMARGFTDPDEIEKWFEALKLALFNFTERCEAEGLTVNHALAKLTRSFIKASDGHRFIIADFAAIEDRIVCWLANETEALEQFRNNEDLYCRMAERIYAAASGSFRKETHFSERQMGKQVRLGCQYQMAEKTFTKTCEGYGIDVDFLSEDYECTYQKEGREYSTYRTFPDMQTAEGWCVTKGLKFVTAKRIGEAERIIRVYRSAVPKIAGRRDPDTGFISEPGLWQLMEKAAVKCLQDQKLIVVNKHLAFEPRGDDLQMILPSGRRLTYHGASVKKKRTPWGTEKDLVFYWSVDAYTSQWVETSTYGGKLTENAVQAIGADIQTAALRRLWNTGYRPVLHVHDEVVCEVRNGFGSVGGVCATMCELPGNWAKGLPIAAEGNERRRFMKT